MAAAQTFQQIQQIAEATPSWANWLIIVGSAATSWLAPIAAFVTILWVFLQAYIAIVKFLHWRKNKDKK